MTGLLETGLEEKTSIIDRNKNILYLARKNKFCLNTLFDPMTPRHSSKSAQTLIEEATPFHSMKFGTKHYYLRCRENKTYSPSELYQHCVECYRVTLTRNQTLHDPFHLMLGLFLEYMYAQEQPRSSMFHIMTTQQAQDTCIDTTFYSNKKKNYSMSHILKLDQVNFVFVIFDKNIISLFITIHSTVHKSNCFIYYNNIVNHVLQQPNAFKTVVEIIFHY